MKDSLADVPARAIEALLCGEFGASKMLCESGEIIGADITLPPFAFSGSTGLGPVDTESTSENAGAALAQLS